MSQDQQSGATANKWGRETAQMLIKAFGGKSASNISNEFSKDGESLVMKCANLDTTSVGVSYKMLDRIDAVVAAFAASPTCFSVYRMDSDQYKECMCATRSQGRSAGKVGLVTKKSFVEMGKSLGETTILAQ